MVELPDYWEADSEDREVTHVDHQELLRSYGGPGCFDDFLWVYGTNLHNKNLNIKERTSSSAEINLQAQTPSTPGDPKRFTD